MGIPEKFSKAVKYASDGLVGIGNWVGYLLAAAYYAGLEYGYGETVCETLGYGYVLIDTLHTLLTSPPMAQRRIHLRLPPTKRSKMPPRLPSMLLVSKLKMVKPPSLIEVIQYVMQVDDATFIQ